ncbi:MAG: hypothetical protein MUE44_32435 [Oscillatoriaceae cyanobacterium Prado104]|nr:hypothetical protein [Oscillatoriaceae cyanobacterium Prado104]
MSNFIDAIGACKILNCSSRSLLRYRQQGKLLEGIHWGRNPSSKVLYDRELLENLVVCGGDVNHPDHQKFIQRILLDRPENQNQKKKQKAKSLEVGAA